MNEMEELEYLKGQVKDLRELLTAIIHLSSNEKGVYLHKNSVITKIIELWLKETEIS